MDGLGSHSGLPSLAGDSDGGQARMDRSVIRAQTGAQVGHAEPFLAPEKLTTPKGEASVESSPIGVLFGVEPWNFPHDQIARFAASNLLAGHVVRVKHASSVPQCALAFEHLLLDAGAPDGAYTNRFISKEQVAQVKEDPRVRGVALTGSEAAGATVAAQAGKHL